MLYTGDLGYIDDDGYLFIVDRKKDLIKTSGYQVWPREIEEVISAHPRFTKSELPDCLTRCAEKKQRRGSFSIRARRLTEAEIKSWCRDRLAPYKVPAKYEFVRNFQKPRSARCCVAHCGRRRRVA